MELDKRIKSIDDIQTILHYDVDCIGKKGYFFDEFIQTKDLSKCRYGELVDIITDNHDLCFKAELENKNTIYFRFFLQESDLKPIEKKYRPFKDHAEYKEYLNDGIIESWIQIREKLTGEVSELMYVGGSGAIICLGSYSFDLNSLFYDFELFNENTCEWQPFGIKE